MIQKIAVICFASMFLGGASFAFVSTAPSKAPETLRPMVRFAAGRCEPIGEGLIGGQMLMLYKCSSNTSVFSSKASCLTFCD